MSFLYLAVEDELSEAVGLRLIRRFLGEGIYVHSLRQNGFGYLKANLKNFAQIAKNYGVLVITDLDRVTCAPVFVEQWFGDLEKPDKLVFRVAVREVEAWILADRAEFAAYLGISEHAVPAVPDSLPDPKAELVRLAIKAPRAIRADITPERGSRSPQGLGYNRALSKFVNERWAPDRAQQSSESLRRACQRLIQLAEHI